MNVIKAIRFLIRRGTNEEHKTFIGKKHELTFDEDERRIIHHDGLNPFGDSQTARKDEVLALDVRVKSNETAISTIGSGVFEWRADVGYLAESSFVIYAGKIYKSLQGTPSDLNVNKNPANEPSYWKDMFLSAQAVSNEILGEIKQALFIALPAKYGYCDGGMINGLEYTELMQALIEGKLPVTTLSEFNTILANNENNCLRFGWDAASKSIRKPQIADGVTLTQAFTSTEKLKYYTDAMRNITGRSNICDDNWQWYEGAFYKDTTVSSRGVDNDGTFAWGTAFDASRSVGAAHIAPEVRNKQIRVPYIIYLGA
jgi:hypothetical protein